MQLEKRLGAANPNYVHYKGNRKHPPKSTAITKSKKNDTSSDYVITGKDSLPIFQFVGMMRIFTTILGMHFLAVKYSPKIGGVSMWLK